MITRVIVDSSNEVMIIASIGRTDLEHSVLMLTFKPKPTIAIVKMNVVKTGVILIIVLGMCIYLPKI